jgi:hypothetical protein
VLIGVILAKPYRTTVGLKRLCNAVNQRRPRICYPQSMPFVPLILTLAGAVPFAIGVASIHFGWPFDRLYGHALVLTYGAIILSFLGGIHWGYAVAASATQPNPHANGYWLSIAAALIAWGAVLLPDGKLALNLMIVTYAWLWFNDWRLASRGLIPKWFMALRSAVTTIVVCLLVLATLGK